MPYIPRSSQHFEYARRIARGENAGQVIRSLGVTSKAVREWRRDLREQAEKELGFRPPYVLLALLATAPDPIRRTVHSAIVAHHAETPPH